MFRKCSVMFLAVLCAGSLFAQPVEHCSTEIVAIPGPTGTSSATITVSDEYLLADLDVAVDISHTFIGDLVIDLESPQGTVVGLHYQQGGSSDNIQATYDDSGQWCTWSFVTDIPIQPSGPGWLSDFNGESITGDWTLHMADCFIPEDDGQLNSFCLKSTPLIPSPPIDPADENITCVSTPTPIPEGPGGLLVTEIVVNESSVIGEVTAHLDISHTYIGDLYIELSSPLGTTAVLHDAGGGWNNNINVTYSDEGAAPGSSYDCSCVIQGIDSLSVFDGEDSSGVWTLRIIDTFWLDSGVLNSFCLDITPSTNFLTGSQGLTGLSPNDVPPVKDRITGNSLIPNYVVDKDAAIRLGKALFWDMQAGSDGQACASCHFHAGADNRTKNQLSPSFLGGNNMFDPTGSGGAGGPNYDLIAADFPFHRLADPNDRDSQVLFSTDDVASSQGVYPSFFNSILPGSVLEDCNIANDGSGDLLGFHVNGTNVRRVEPRNTPTVINAALNFRNFWDGRANNIFNGVDPFGRRNENARILEVNSDGSVSQIQVEFENASLASQAVGPPTSEFEMSCQGRVMTQVGQKLLSLPPLALQKVHPNDSVLSSLALYPNPGLSTTYAEMVQAAFHERFWNSETLFDINQQEVGSGPPTNVDQFTLMESNFPMFWGLALHLYQATLISDDSPFDQNALTNQEQLGLKVFRNKGKCENCHGTAVFTDASTLHLLDEDEEGGLVERMNMADEQKRFTVRGEGTIHLGGQPAFSIKFDAEGTPGVENGQLTTGPGAGTIELTDLATGDHSTFSVYKFNLDADRRSSTRDAYLRAALVDGGFWAQDIRVWVDDNTNLVSFRIPSYGYTMFRKTLSDGDVQLCEPALYDNGFYNIGVRPTVEDIGVGGEDPFGNPLSFTRQYVDFLKGQDPRDPFEIDPCKFDEPFDLVMDLPFFPGGFGPLIECDSDEDGIIDFVTAEPANNAANLNAINNIRVAVDGAFKTPGLRNIELTGPYMHNGGHATLEQVVEFYNRGGDFARQNRKDLDPDIRPLGLTQEEKDALVAFMKALTDDRVRYERAPFDHPQLFLSDGHAGDEFSVQDDNDDGQADDSLIFLTGAFIELPAVGAEGREAEGLPPLKAFLEESFLED